MPIKTQKDGVGSASGLVNMQEECCAPREHGSSMPFATHLALHSSSIWSSLSYILL